MRPFSCLFTALCLFLAVSGVTAQTLRWNTPEEGVTRKSPTAATPSAPLQSNEVETGYVTYYADYLVGQPTASGEFYRHDLLTAAHRTLPFGTLLKVTRLDNNVSVTVRVNDRGTLCDGCVLSVSRSAAEALQMVKSGKIMVAVQEVGYSNYSPRPETTLTARGQGISPTTGQPAAYDYPAATGRSSVATADWDPSYDNPNAGRPGPSPEAYSNSEWITPRPYGSAPRPEGAASSGVRGGVNNQQPGTDYTRRPAGPITPNTPARPTPAPSSYDEMAARSAYRETAMNTAVAPNAGEVQIAANAVRGFGIQVGAYSNFANAERRVVSLQEQGLNNVFIKQDSQRGLNRVILGPYASSAAAKSELQRIEAELALKGLVLDLQ